MKAAKWISIAGLLLVAGLWPNLLPPFDTAARVVVAAGALVVMFGGFNTRQYAVATVSAALVLLYNPLSQAFTFSGDWQRFVVEASAIPFAVSLGWRSRTEHNG